MRQLRLFLLVLLIVAMGGDMQAKKKIKCPLKGYELVWHDEFDGDSLSRDWTHEVKRKFWVNQELQNYVRITTPLGWHERHRRLCPAHHNGGGLCPRFSAEAKIG